MDLIDRYDVFTNFKWYGLPMPNVIAMDFSFPILRYREIFDAIVCDPPYGIRAGSKKTKGTQDKIGKYLP